MSALTRGTDGPEELAERIALLETKAVLAALWLFVLLNMVFRDLHEIVKADFLEGALAGTYYGQEVTEVLFLLGGLIVEVPILMMLLTVVLPYRVNRRANLIVAPVVAFTLVPPGDLDDFFHVAVKLAALAAIVWQAWRWRPPAARRSAPGAPGGAGLRAGADAPPADGAADDTTA